MRDLPLPPSTGGGGSCRLDGLNDSGDRHERLTTGRDHKPTAVRKAEAGSPGAETPSKVAANPHPVSLGGAEP